MNAQVPVDLNLAPAARQSRTGTPTVWRLSFIVGMAVLAVPSTCRSATLVYPNAYATAHGPAYDNLPLYVVDRTHLIIVASSELAALQPGDLIAGLTWRVKSRTAAPSVDLNFSDYDVFLGQAAVPPLSIQSTLADNYVADTRTQVRSGPLSIPAGSFPGLRLPDPADFGIPISLSPYAYQGGDLVIELSHRGSLYMDVPQMDAIYLPSEQMNAVYSRDYGASTGAQDTTVAIGQLHFEPAVFAGDFDGDDDVDGNDFLLWQRGESPNAGSQADLESWQSNFGASRAVVSGTAAPEPAAGIISLTVLLLWPRRETRSRAARGSVTLN